MKTVLITGCSSGFGLETVRHFLGQGWKVIATMRTPRLEVLPPSGNLRVMPLDVTSAQSIQEAVAAAGDVDALVNNAGIGMLGRLGRYLDANRARNLRNQYPRHDRRYSSAAASVPNPPSRNDRQRYIERYIAIASIAIGLYRKQSSGQRVHRFPRPGTQTVQRTSQPRYPGACSGNPVGSNAKPRIQKGIPEAYEALAQSIFARWAESSPITLPEDVAEAVWCAVNDPSPPARIYAGRRESR